MLFRYRLAQSIRKVLRLVCNQGRIQTTFTYASAEVTSAVVVIKKIPECPFSPTNYFILFFCRSKRLKRLRPRYAVVILPNLPNVFACLSCGKNCFSRKYSKIQSCSRKSLKIPSLFSNAWRIQQNTRAEQITDYFVRQLF